MFRSSLFNIARNIGSLFTHVTELSLILCEPGYNSLISNSLILCRHQAREAEPKDYDIKDYQPQKRNLHNSTYHRIGNVTDGVSFDSIKTF